MNKNTNNLQLITLNIWGGTLAAPLINFIGDHKEIDIFCFQEVLHNHTHESDYCAKFHPNIYSEILKALPDHLSFFRPVVWGTYGLAIFIRKEIEVLSSGYKNIYECHNPGAPIPSHSRDLQWLRLRKEDEVFSIVNVHGLWTPVGKIDTTERIDQSRNIREFIKSIKSPVILCGDLNLRNDTESISIISTNLQNLIEKHNIKSTRSSIYDKDEKYSDYIFTSPEVKTIDIKVHNVCISDHSPIELIFSLDKCL